MSAKEDEAQIKGNLSPSAKQNIFEKEFSRGAILEVLSVIIDFLLLVHKLVLN